MIQTECKMSAECLEIQGEAQRLFRQLSPNEERQNALLRLVDSNSRTIKNLKRELGPLEQLANAPDAPEQELEKWIECGKPSSGRIGRILGRTSIASRSLSPLGVAIAFSALKTQAQAKAARIERETRDLESENRDTVIELARLKRQREEIIRARSNLIAKFRQMECGPSMLLRTF